MTQQELENTIRKTLKTDSSPDRVSFAQMLSKLKEVPVTEDNALRYTTETATSKITSNKITNFIDAWKSKWIILVPSFILLIFIGSFSLSRQTGKYNLSIEQLAQQIETMEADEVVDDNEEQIIDSFDKQAIDDFSLIQNEF